MAKRIVLGATLMLSCTTSVEPGADAPRPSMTTAPRVEASVPPPPSAAPEHPPTVVPIEVVAGAGWTMFHGNAARTGMSEAPAIKKPRILWKTKVGIQGWLNGPLVISAKGSKLVVVPSSGTTHNKADASDGVHAIDAQTGKVVWQAKLDNDANGAAASGDRIFVTSDDGNAYAIEAATGKVLWKHRGSGKMYAHPLVLGERVIVGDAGGNVRALSASDGKEVWKTRLSGAIRGGASAADDRIFVASENGDVVALDPNGKTLWTSRVTRPAFSGAGTVPIEAYSPPLVTPDAVVIGFARDTTYTNAPALVALDKKTGAVKWRATGIGEWGNIRSTPVLVRGLLVYGEPYSGDVAAIDASNGKLAFRKTVGACFFPQWASPAAAGSTAYVPRFDGTLYAIDASDGSVSWSVYLGDSKKAAVGGAGFAAGSCNWEVPSGFPLYSPVAIADDGTLYAGSEEGFLFAIGESR